MKVVVVGAGAVGCFYGAKLACAGHAVHLIGRANHVGAVRANGLILEVAGRREIVAVSGGTDAGEVEAADLVLVSVKSEDAGTVGRAIASRLSARATVVSLQNGVDTADRLGEAAGRPVIPAAVYVAVEMAGPGHVRHHGRGELVIGAGPASGMVASAFGAAGVPTEVSDNIAGVLWTKLIVNCAYNGLSAVPQLPYGRMIAVGGVTAVMSDIVEECRAVADALGVQLEGDARSGVETLASTMPAQFSSTAQDLARGRRSEIDHLNGFIVRAGERVGVKTPANRAVWAMVKLLEAKAIGTGTLRASSDIRA